MSNHAAMRGLPRSLGIGKAATDLRITDLFTKTGMEHSGSL